MSDASIAGKTAVARLRKSLPQPAAVGRLTYKCLRILPWVSGTGLSPASPRQLCRNAVGGLSLASARAVAVEVLDD